MDFQQVNGTFDRRLLVSNGAALRRKSKKISPGMTIYCAGRPHWMASWRFAGASILQPEKEDQRTEDTHVDPASVDPASVDPASVDRQLSRRSQDNAAAAACLCAVADPRSRPCRRSGTGDRGERAGRLQVVSAGHEFPRVAVPDSTQQVHFGPA